MKNKVVVVNKSRFEENKSLPNNVKKKKPVVEHINLESLFKE